MHIYNIMVNTNKKSNKIPHNGGGGAMSSISEAYSDYVEGSSKPADSSKPAVLYITTHGGYDDELANEEYDGGMNIRKINAVTVGVCNYLWPETASEIANLIIDDINNGKITDLEKGSEIVKDCALSADFEKSGWGDTYRKGISGMVEYDRQSDRLYQIKTITDGVEYMNKNYQVKPEERRSNVPYNNTITLLSDKEPHIDLFKEMHGESYVEGPQEVTLYRVLTYLKEKKGITNLIILDLTCSRTEKTSREDRYTNRLGTAYGGYKKNTKKRKTKKRKNTKRKTKKRRKYKTKNKKR
jgi:hypothetical protein